MQEVEVHTELGVLGAEVLGDDDPAGRGVVALGALELLLARRNDLKNGSPSFAS